MGKIADMLNSMKVKPKIRDTWTRGAIAEILINPVYMGKIRWNYRVNVKGWENQQTVVSRPRRSLEDMELFDGLHEAIISEELFWLAYTRKSKNVPLKKSNELKNPLAGIFYCAKCSKAMKMRAPRSNYDARFECCEIKFCGNGSIAYSDIMNDIATALKKYIEDFSVDISGDNSEDLSQHQLIIESLEKRLEELERKELSLWDKYAEEGMPKQVFDKLIEKVTEEKKEVKESLRNAKENAPTKVDYEEKVYLFSQALNSITDDSISAEAKNTYLRAAISKITLEREKSVLLTKEMAAEMGVPYTHKLCHHHFPYTLDITPQV
jgi:hypothetical protein